MKHSTVMSLIPPSLGLEPRTFSSEVRSANHSDTLMCQMLNYLNFKVFKKLFSPM